MCDFVVSCSVTRTRGAGSSDTDQCRTPNPMGRIQSSAVNHEEWPLLAAKFGPLFRTHSARAAVDATVFQRRLELDRLRRDVRRKPASRSRFALASWDIWRERLDDKVKVESDGRSLSSEDVGPSSVSSSRKKSSTEGPEDSSSSLVDQSCLIKTLDRCHGFYETDMQQPLCGTDRTKNTTQEPEESGTFQNDSFTLYDGAPSPCNVHGDRDLKYFPTRLSDNISSRLPEQMKRNVDDAVFKIHDPVFEATLVSSKLLSEHVHNSPTSQTVVPRSDVMVQVGWDDMKPRSCSLGDDIRSSVSDLGSSKELLDSSVSENGYFCPRSWQRSASDDSDLGSSKDDLSSRSSCNDTMVDLVLFECVPGVGRLVSSEVCTECSGRWKRHSEDRASVENAQDVTYYGGSLRQVDDDPEANMVDDVECVIDELITKEDIYCLPSSETKMLGKLDGEHCDGHLAMLARVSSDEIVNQTRLENLDSNLQPAQHSPMSCSTDFTCSTLLPQTSLHSQIPSQPLSSSEQYLQRIISLDHDLSVAETKDCNHCDEKMSLEMNTNRHQECDSQENGLAGFCSAGESSHVPYTQTNALSGESCQHKIPDVQASDKSAFCDTPKVDRSKSCDANVAVDVLLVDDLHDNTPWRTDIGTDQSDVEGLDSPIEMADCPDATPDSPVSYRDPHNDSFSNRKCYVYLEEDAISEETTTATTTSSPTPTSSTASSLESLSSRKSRPGGKFQQHRHSSCLKSVTSALRRLPSPGKYLSSHRSVYDLQLAASTYFPICPASPEDVSSQTALPHLLTFTSLSDLGSSSSSLYSSYPPSPSLSFLPPAPPCSPITCPPTPPGTPTLSPKVGRRRKGAKTFSSPLLSSKSSHTLFPPLSSSSPSMTLPFLSKPRSRSLSMDSRMTSTSLPRPSKRALRLGDLDNVDSARIATGNSRVTTGNSLPMLNEFDAKKVDRTKQSSASQGSKAKQETKAQQFGLSLQEIKENTGRIIPRPVEDTIDFLKSANADEVEGLFRRCARVSTMREVQEKYDDGETVDFDEYGDSHLAGAILKKFLRELSEPLMTFELFEPITRLHFLEQSKQVGEVQRILKDELPEDNYIILKHIFQFLQQVISKSDINLMTAANMATVFGPNIAWPKGQANLSNVEQAVKFALILLENFDDVFLR